MPPPTGALASSAGIAPGFARGARCAPRQADGDWRDAVLDAYTALDMYMSTVPVRARYDGDASLLPIDIVRLREELKFSTSDANKALGAAFAVASVVSGKRPPKFWNSPGFVDIPGSMISTGGVT